LNTPVVSLTVPFDTKTVDDQANYRYSAPYVMPKNPLPNTATGAIEISQRDFRPANAIVSYPNAKHTPCSYTPRDGWINWDEGRERNDLVRIFLETIGT